ncbi:MAG: thiamine-phosphate kinase [Rikenellaceae bacterium]
MKRTEIVEIGQFGLIDRLAQRCRVANDSTVMGVGDDAAVIAAGGDELMLISSDSLFEGVDFDLTYFPLKHLGYKAIVVAANDILAMNGSPRQATVSLGVSAKLPVEALEDLYDGMRLACDELEIDLVGGDTRASMTGLVISTTMIGVANGASVTYRSGAQPNDLICITGSLGAAYLGLKLLEREKSVLSGAESLQPQFEGYEHLLASYLKPTSRYSMIDSLREAELIPTSMIDLSDGLASDLLQVCKSSQCGARIYLERIPIAKQSSQFAAELSVDPVVAALNGGEDHELLFTIPLSEQEKIASLGCVDIIGHITPYSSGASLVTPDGAEITLKAQGFPEGLQIVND